MGLSRPGELAKVWAAGAGCSVQWFGFLFFTVSHGSPPLFGFRHNSACGRAFLLRLCLPLLVAGCCLCCGGVSVSAGELAERIDRLLQQSLASAQAEPGPISDDAEFCRRVTLDLIGRIPFPAELATFLGNPDAQRRAILIDQLLSSPEHSRRMADLFHVMLMERRGDHPEWLGFLRTSFADQKPWDQLVREILDPQETPEQIRGAAWFITRRLEKVGQQETDYPGLTRDIGRLFLGCDLQCAQCHDHLTISAYRQIEFQGLYTVYRNTSIRTDVKFPAVAEKPLTKKTDFMSVFDKQPLTVGPRVPFGVEQEIPQYESGQEFAVAPDRATNFPGVPKFRGLQLIAQSLPVAENRRFAENLANRLWFVMFGRGLVNPLDQLHDDNPATHPEVLAVVADAVTAAGFQIRPILRELALSQAYQRSSVGASAEQVLYQYGREKRLSAEQLLASVLTACGDGAMKAAGEAPSEAEQKRAEAFVKAFGNVPGEPELEFSPSLKAALFVLNDPLLQEQLQPSGGNLSERLASLADNGAVADQLYRSVLSRLPDPEEVQFVTDYLERRAEARRQAIGNLIWGLLASTEFCLNH